MRATVGHAWRHVPYYRETMRHLNLTPADVRTQADLAKLPIIGPDQLQRDPEYFVSDAVPIERYLLTVTSGTSGAPRSYFRDAGSVAKDAVHFTRLLAIAKRLAGKARPSQAFILPAASTTGTVQAAYRAISLNPRRAGAEQQRLSLLDSPEEHLAILNRMRPDVIFAFGSSLEALFSYAEASGRRLHRPAAVIYGADHLSDPVRELISGRFGIPVLNTYSATEMPQIGFACDAGRSIHVNVDLYPLRILDRGGGEAGPGESGEIVVSNLVNRGTILLNYRLGDLATPVTEPCGCGRTLPRISLLRGRAEDWLVTESGARVHPQAVAPIWKALPAEIRSYQLRQHRPGSVTMSIVAAPGSDLAAVRDAVERESREIFKGEITLSVSFTDSLPRTEAGKVKAVISDLAQPGS